MSEALIVDVVRTAAGCRDGALSGWHPADLAGEVLAALVDRNRLDPAALDEVVLGCASQVGAQGFNLGRNAVLAGGLPEGVGATTVDRQCASSHQALAFAAQAVGSGARDLVVAAGVEVVSLVPSGATFGVGIGSPFGPRVAARYADGGLVPPGLSAERIAEAEGLGRADLDAWAARSHRRAATARDEGRFAAEVLAVAAKRRDRETGEALPPGGRLTADETIDDGATVAALAGAKPAVAPDGVVTAANTAAIADGAAAVLVAGPEAVARLGLTPRARIHASVGAGVDPRVGLTGAVPATQAALRRCGLALREVDRVELHESFAAVALAAVRALGADEDRVNVNGGAIALGHPVGATGARATATLLCELERTGGRWGLLATGAVGGLGNATVIERLG